MAGNGPHYQAGNYIGEVLQQGLSKARTGNPQIVLRVKVLGTPNQEGSYLPDPFQYERTIYMTITQNTIDFIADALESLGYTREGFGPIDPSHPHHQSFTGLQVDLYCTHEPDQNGNLREKWRISNGGSKGMDLTPLDQKDLRQLDALFGKSLRAGAPASPAPAQKQTATQPQSATSARSMTAEISDDDIPF